MEKIDKWLYFGIIILAVFFVFRLIDHSQLLSQFPFDYNNDIAAHMGQLYFLKQYGFHGFVSNWYNGFVLFYAYPPAWYYFTLPLYNFLSNIQLATYASHTLIYLIGLIFFLILGKSQKFTLPKTLFLYLIFYTNPVAIGNFIKVARMHELLSLTLFIPLFTLILYFKDRKLNNHLFLFIILYSLVLLSHPSFFIISSIFVLSFFLIKTNKERFEIFLAFLAVIIITSFWLIPFLVNSTEASFGTDIAYTGLSRLLNIKLFLFDNLLSFILPVFFLFISYFYYNNLEEKTKKKEFLFWLPMIIFSFLYFFRIAAFIPILKNVFPDSYNMLFIFLSGFLFFKIPLKSYKGILPVIKISLVLLPILLIVSSYFFVSNFRTNNQVDKEILTLLPKIGGRFFITSLPYPSNPQAFYSYGAIYYNLSTPSGWNPVVASRKYVMELEMIDKSLNEKDCKNFITLINQFEIDEIISYGEDCQTLELCGLKEKDKMENTCLFINKRIMP